MNSNRRTAVVACVFFIVAAVATIKGLIVKGFKSTVCQDSAFDSRKSRLKWDLSPQQCSMTPAAT